MAASTHWLASATAMAVLERGGNAFDAAVAGGFVLQVVEPHLNGPGGELPVVLWSAARREPLVICGQGSSPAAATIGLLRDELGLSLVPGTGLLAACVPGAFDAWMLMLREFGTLRLGEVLAYAIGYAGGGFPVLPSIAATIDQTSDLFVREWTTSAEVWLSHGRASAPGTMMRNEQLAATYARLVAEAERATSDREGQIEHARDAWLRGWVADAIVEWSSSHAVLDASGSRHAGLLTREDLADWSATIEPPVRGACFGLELCKTGPWGQGPMLLQTLRLLDGFDLRAVGSSTADYVHTVVEALKLAFADRDAFYGDSAAEPPPLETLLSARYADERRALIGERASLEFMPGSVDGVPGRLPAATADIAAMAAAGAGGGSGDPTLGSGGAAAGAGGPRDPTLGGDADAAAPATGDTCHLDVADRLGNLVSCTPSGGWLQSSPAIPGLGFCLGTRAQMFWLEEGLPSSLAPRRRPRTTLSPSLLLRDGEGAIAFGTPGGDQQEQWSLEFLVNHVVFGMNLQEAIDAPMFHTGHLRSSFWPRSQSPGLVEIEERFGRDVVAELRRRGHRVTVHDGWSLGRVSAVARDPDGTLRAGANPRGMQGYAAGR
jgi:gamma-glutamyltranspeptidase/glutathione hydrolase